MSSSPRCTTRTCARAPAPAPARAPGRQLHPHPHTAPRAPWQRPCATPIGADADDRVQEQRTTECRSSARERRCGRRLAVDIDGVLVGSASSQTHTPPPTMRSFSTRERTRSALCVTRSPNQTPAQEKRPRGKVANRAINFYRTAKTTCMIRDLPAEAKSPRTYLRFGERVERHEARPLHFRSAELPSHHQRRQRLLTRLLHESVTCTWSPSNAAASGCCWLRSRLRGWMVPTAISATYTARIAIRAIPHERSDAHFTSWVESQHALNTHHPHN